MECQTHIPQTQFALAWQMLRSEEPSAPVEGVIKAVCNYFGITKRELLLPRRQENIVRRRFIAVYLARETTSKSLPQIGKVFGFDHTSVMHACRRAEDLIQTNEFFACAVDEIRSILNRNSEELPCPNQQ